MNHAPTPTDPVTKVARNLSAIEDMTTQLLTQAIHSANDREIPGGLAMVALASVASPEAWEHIFETNEALERDTTYADDQDDVWEPPLQTLLFWSEQWRIEHGYELDRRPTIASEANFIRWALNWAYDHEPRFDDMARDIRRARKRLEDVLHDGIRVERGAPCMYDECGGTRLIRRIANDGQRSDWCCPRCKREWDEDRYWANVRAANERAQREEIGTETWCSVDYAARDVNRSPKTIRTWVTRGKVSTACIVLGRRTRFVNLDEVRECDAEAKRRQGVA